MLAAGEAVVDPTRNSIDHREALPGMHVLHIHVVSALLSTPPLSLSHCVCARACVHACIFEDIVQLLLIVFDILFSILTD